MGKIIRYLSLFLILLLTNSFYSYYQAMEYTVSEDEMDSFIKMIHQEEEKWNCSMFWIVIENNSRLHQKIYIYSDSKIIQKELSKKHIYEGEYESFFSGSSSVTYKKSSECRFDDFNSSKRMSIDSMNLDDIDCY